jgi:hypothetical protein
MSIRTFGPGGSITLDYPGLSMYVPSVLSCVEIDVTFDEPAVPVVVELPPFVPVIDPIWVEPVVDVVPPIVDVLPPPVDKIPPIVIPATIEPPVIVPVVKAAAKAPVKKPIKKTKK